MKKIILGLAFLTIVSCTQEKIAYVDYVKLIQDYQEKIDVEAKFKIKADALTKKRDSITQAFQIEGQAFQLKAQNMPQQKAQEEYAVFQQRGQFIGQQLQEEDQKLQQEGKVEMDSVLSTIKKAVTAYGKTKGFSYILAGGEGGAVLYGTEQNDITSEMVKILNDKYNN